MSIEITKNGIVKIIQGDTGYILVDGIPTDKNYDVYFAIRRKDRTLRKMRNRNSYYKKNI